MHVSSYSKLDIAKALCSELLLDLPCQPPRHLVQESCNFFREQILCGGTSVSLTDARARQTAFSLYLRSTMWIFVQIVSKLFNFPVDGAVNLVLKRRLCSREDIRDQQIVPFDWAS